jgi:thiosulfate dehydrogenase [quinone] large subunit
MAKNTSQDGESSGKGPGEGKKWLAILRIYLGAFFLSGSLEKFTTSYIGEFSRMASRWAHDSSFEMYRNFLDQWVLPHAKFYAYFTAIGEFCVGVSLLFGILSGLGVILGVLIYINYLLGSDEKEVIWRSSHVIVSLFVVLFTKAGRVFGFDKYLAKKILFKYLV